jgi:hypothetical protein
LLQQRLQQLVLKQAQPKLNMMCLPCHVLERVCDTQMSDRRLRGRMNFLPTVSRTARRGSSRTLIKLP